MRSPCPVALRQTGSGDLARIGQGLKRFFHLVDHVRLAPGRAKLRHDFVAVGDQDGFAGSRKADVLGQSGLQLFDSDNLHKAMVTTGSHESQLSMAIRRRLWAPSSFDCTPAGQGGHLYDLTDMKTFSRLLVTRAGAAAWSASEFSRLTTATRLDCSRMETA